MALRVREKIEIWGRQREVGETISGLCGHRKGMRDGASDEREGKHDRLREREAPQRHMRRGKRQGRKKQEARRALETWLS